MLVVYDEIYGDHLRGIPHPESPDRVKVVASFLRERGYLDSPLAARDATDDELLRAHTRSYIDTVETEVASLRGIAGYLSTGDTVVDSSSMRVARRAAGGAVTAAMTAAERGEAVFALVRPPGHHAESARGMGFCVFNNAVVAARAVQDAFGYRTLVVDFDYHHGNGTQAVAGEGLSYVSTHGYPAYPGTGSVEENYRLRADAVLNVPLPPHAFGTEAFVALWERLLPQVAAAVRPQMLIISAGFDYVAGDPVGDLGVQVEAAAHLAALVRSTAAEYCGGRACYVLEGGYDPSAIARSVAAVIETHDGAAALLGTAHGAAVPAAQDRTLRRIETVLA